MKKIIKESKEANTKAGKQTSNMLAGKHRNINQAPENKLFSKLAKNKKARNSLTYTP